MAVYRGRRFDTNQAVQVQVEEGIITEITPLAQTEAKGLPILAPGLFDIQINGGWGVEFSSPLLTAGDVAQVSQQVLATGTFRYCPTLTTNDAETVEDAVEVIAEAIDCYPECESVIAGIHLEGPFISAEDGPRGAHPARHVQKKYDIDFIDRLIDQSGGLIKIVTFSPEYDKADEFITALKERGIIPAIGHTNAHPIQISEAAAAGAVLSTHLGNGSFPFLPKAGNYFFAQLTDDRLYASIIADGFHLSPLMIETIRRCKGKKRLILVSDQSSVAGLPPGFYSTDLSELELLESGKIVLAQDRRLLAAASFPLARDICNMTAVTGLPLKDVFAMATRHPAQLLNLPPYSNGEEDFLAVGKNAEFLLFRLERSRLGEYGIADWDAQVRGRFQFEAIVHPQLDESCLPKD